jgi:hypothetical protein
MAEGRQDELFEIFRAHQGQRLSTATLRRKYKKRTGEAISHAAMSAWLTAMALRGDIRQHDLGVDTEWSWP